MENNINKDEQVVFINNGQNNQNQSLDSIVFNESNIIISYLFQYFHIYLGAFSLQYLIISTFQLDFGILNLAVILALLCILPFFIFHKFRALRLFLVLILYCIFILLNLKKVIISAVLCINQVITIINEPYSLGIKVFSFPGFSENIQVGQGIIIILASILIVLAVGRIILTKHSAFKAALGNIAVLLFCLSFDVIPSMLSIIFVVAYLLSVLSMTTRFNKDTRKSVIILVLGLVFFLFGFLSLIIPGKNYKRLSAFEDARIFVQNIMNPDWDTESMEEEGTGGINGGKLGRYDTVKYINQTLFQLNSISLSQDQYYKCFIGGVYRDNGWEDISESLNGKYEDTFQSFSRNRFKPETQTGDFLNFLKMNHRADVLKYNFSIQYMGANRKYWIIPYGSTVSAPQKSAPDGYPIDCQNTSIQGEVYHVLKPLNYSEIANYLNDYQGTDENLNKYIYSEKLYRNYVYNVYTKMPENTDFIKDHLEAGQIENKGDMNDCIDGIVAYLSSHFQYTLSPGRVPDNRDFADYFMNESKQGYCTYFATAATLMFRSAGIPARYVEGYKVTANELQDNITTSTYLEHYDEAQKKSVKENVDIASMEVKDENAHAWVEIYRDGYGWQPVEVTPSVNANYDNSLSASTEMDSNIEESSPAVQEASTVSTDMKETSVMEKENAQDTPKPKMMNAKKIVILFVFLLLLLFLVWRIAIFIKARLYIRKLLAYRRYITDYNDQIIKIYHYIERIMKAFNLKKPQYMDDMTYYLELQEKTNFFAKCDINAIISIVYKVKFGNYHAMKKEAVFVTKETAELRKIIWKRLSIWGRVKFILKRL